jgi:predicted DNA-binding transcriptional regulator YafY
MPAIIETVLKQALQNGLPVIIIYHGEKEMTQRRIYVRGMDDESVTAYCTVKKALRHFKMKNILSAVIAEE